MDVEINEWWQRLPVHPAGIKWRYWLTAVVGRARRADTSGDWRPAEPYALPEVWRSQMSAPWMTVVKQITMAQDKAADNWSTAELVVLDRRVSRWR